MIHSKTLLKDLRTESPLDQKDVAQLIDIKASNLVRYEYGHRNPTPDILLIYHMLFDVHLRDVFAPIYKHITDLLLIRIRKLMAECKAHNSSKSRHKVTFLTEVVNRISNTQAYENN